MKEISRIPKPVKKKLSIGGAGVTNLHTEATQPLRASLKRLPINQDNLKGTLDYQAKPMVSSLVMGRRGISEKQTLYDTNCNQNDMITMMESSLMRENQNLKQQNNFLVNQVKSLFEKEKKFIQALKKAKLHIQQLQRINQRLQQQLYFITKNTLGQIERIQKLIKSQKIIICEEHVLSQVSEIHKSDTMRGWETEATINHTLEQLRCKVNDLVQPPAQEKRIYQEREPRQSIKSSRYSQKNYADQADESATSETVELNFNSNKNIDFYYLQDQRQPSLRNSGVRRQRNY